MMLSKEEVFYIGEFSKFRSISVRLGKYNLSYLLQLLSFFSSLAFSGLRRSDDKDFIFYVYLSPMFLGSLSKAVLYSNSKTSKTETFFLADFIEIYNRLKSIDHYIPENKTHFSINWLLASVANPQSCYQDCNIIRELGRSHLLYKAIPEKYGLKDNNWIDCYDLFEQTFGFDFDECFMYMIQLIASISLLFQSSFSEIRKHLDPPEKIVSLGLNEFNRLFSGNNHIAVLNGTALQGNPIVGRYLDFVKDVSMPIKSTGKIIHDKSPLKILSDWNPFRVFPFVEIENNRFIIPSVFELFEFARGLMMHFINSMEMGIKDRIKTNLGPCYEKYVFDYLKSKHPHLLLIPEKHFNNSDKGPDILAIDKKEHTMILIEVKARHLRQVSRQNPTQELDRDGLITLLAETMVKLNRKRIRIRNGEGGYLQYVNEINKCQEDDTHQIVVCGDYGFFIDALVYIHYTKISGDMECQNKYFLDLRGSEDLFEHTAQKGMPLSQALSTLSAIMKGKRPDTNVKDVFSDYDNTQASWYSAGDGILQKYSGKFIT